MEFEAENFMYCPGEQGPFLDFGGELAVGSPVLIPKMGWCLVVEIDYKNIIEAPIKEYKIFRIKNLLFINVLLIVLAFFIGVIFDRKYKINLK